MATHRPGYQRTDTDGANLSEDISKNEFTDKKQEITTTESNKLPTYTGEEDDHVGKVHVSTAEDLVTQVIHVEDDPTVNPWTFRMFFLGE
jgi:hypothetical protein